MNFKLHSQFKPTGDQPQAIEALTRGLNMGLSDQVLLGVTGSGKTFTMANIIANVNRPTLVLAHNKTLAAQLCSEFLLRLLPAGGVYRPDGHVYRKGFRHQRRDRAPAPQRDERAVRAPGRDRRLVRVVYLRPGRPDRL